jgi:hypothetical protein
VRSTIGIVPVPDVHLIPFPEPGLEKVSPQFRLPAALIPAIFAGASRSKVCTARMAAHRVPEPIFDHVENGFREQTHTTACDLQMVQSLSRLIAAIRTSGSSDPFPATFCKTSLLLWKEESSLLISAFRTAEFSDLLPATFSKTNFVSVFIHTYLCFRRFPE